MLHARRDGGLTLREPVRSRVGVWQLLGHGTGDDVLTGAFAWVVAIHCDPAAGEAFVPALGLEPAGFAGLLADRFPHFEPPAGWLAAQSGPVGQGRLLDEFPDLLGLLLEHRGRADESHRLVAHLVATACMANDHLWQDMGLPDRAALSRLLAEHFPALAARNTGNMKWKKFFYKQLCERQGVHACRSPSCAACLDYERCFGSEE
jgi:nitrogen fixation protein NifQ